VRRVALAGAVLVVAVLLLAELLAVPVATRIVGNALAQCLPYDEVEITDVDRPAVPRLLVGRATGVEMRATGLVLGGLRVQEAQLDVPLAILPWAPGSPTPQPATLELLLHADDLEAFLEDELPPGLRPVVGLRPGVAELGMEPFPVRVEVAVAIEDREVHLAPAGEPPDWWDRVPLPESFTLPEDLELTALQVLEDAAAATLVVDELPGVDGAAECTGPLA
jgi:hypothetical protein